MTSIKADRLRAPPNGGPSETPIQQDLISEISAILAEGQDMMAMVRIDPVVAATVLDCRKGFGHTELLALNVPTARG